MTRDQEKRTENVEIAHPSVRREPEQLISNCPKKMVVENSNFTILHYWYEYPNKKTQLLAIIICCSIVNSSK